jgi:hypothetical protein
VHMHPRAKTMRPKIVVYELQYYYLWF